MHGLTHCMHGTFLQLQIMQNDEVLHRHVFCIFLYDTDILKAQELAQKTVNTNPVNRENHDSPLSLTSPDNPVGHLDISSSWDSYLTKSWGRREGKDIFCENSLDVLL